MAQTDRQTDKATHWKTAVFDKDDNWLKLEVLPAFVKQVHRQKEVCPTTNNEHYQVHVECKYQVRFSSICGWIKATKWFPVLGVEHIRNSIAYCSKKDTAVIGTQEVLKGEKYLRIHELLLEVGRAFLPTRLDLPGKDGRFINKPCAWLSAIEVYENQFLFRNAVRPLVQSKGLIWIDKLSNPVVEKMWNIFYREILQELEKEGTFIIEVPDSPVPLGLD
jgi:hypothetical protein